MLVLLSLFSLRQSAALGGEPSGKPPQKGWAVRYTLGHISLWRPSENLLRRSMDENVRPWLTLACDPDGGPSAGLLGFMVGAEARNPRMIPVSFDGEPAVEMRATGIGTGLDFDEPKAFIKRALGHKQLIVRVEPYNQPGTQDLHFEIDGLDAVVGKLLDACGWSPNKKGEREGQREEAVP